MPRALDYLDSSSCFVISVQGAIRENPGEIGPTKINKILIKQLIYRQGNNKSVFYDLVLFFDLLSEIFVCSSFACLRRTQCTV